MRRGGGEKEEEEEVLLKIEYREEPRESLLRVDFIFHTPL